MGRELQKKKNRSSNPRVRIKPRKRANPRSNPIIAENWDPKQTLTQNYRRLGLASRLNTPAGGVEKRAKDVLTESSTERKLAINSAYGSEEKMFTPGEAKIERDPVTGKVIRIVHQDKKKRRENPLNDLLLTDSESEGDGDEEMFEGFEDEMEDKRRAVQTDVVRRLEEEAAKMPERKARKQSQREREWIERLVERHGEDYQKMAWDRRLNPMQQTEADIKRRVLKWKVSTQAEGVEA